MVGEPPSFLVVCKTFSHKECCLNKSGKTVIDFLKPSFCEKLQEWHPEGLIEKSGPFFQVLLQRVHFRTKNRFSGSFVLCFPALACGSSASGDWSERLQFDFSLVTSAFKGTKKAETTTFPPNREAME